MLKGKSRFAVYRWSRILVLWCLCVANKGSPPVTTRTFGQSLIDAVLIIWGVRSLTPACLSHPGACKRCCALIGQLGYETEKLKLTAQPNVAAFPKWRIFQGFVFVAFKFLTVARFIAVNFKIDIMLIDVSRYVSPLFYLLIIYG